MKRFEAPEIAIQMFEVEDIITTSDVEFVPPTTAENQTPYG